MDIKKLRKVLQNTISLAVVTDMKKRRTMMVVRIKTDIDLSLARLHQNVSQL